MYSLPSDPAALHQKQEDVQTTKQKGVLINAIHDIKDSFIWHISLIFLVSLQRLTN